MVDWVLLEDALDKLLQLRQAAEQWGETLPVLDPSLQGPLLRPLLSLATTTTTTTTATVLQQSPALASVMGFLRSDRVQDLSWAALELPSGLSKGRWTLLFVIRPTIKALKQVRAQMLGLVSAGSGSSNLAASVEVVLYFVPVISFVCQHYLEEMIAQEKNQACKALLQKAHARIDKLPITGFIPFDRDVFSLEHLISGGGGSSNSSQLRQVKLEGDSSSLMHSARAILDLQAIFGQIPNIRVKGSMSKAILDLMINITRETPADGGSSTGTIGLSPTIISNALNEDAYIDTLVMLDRNVDFVSALCTPLTYEALVDEIFGIRHTICNIDREMISDDPPATATPGGGGKVSVVLTSNDAIFSAVRDFSMEGNVFMRYLNEQAIKLKQDKEKVQKTKDPIELQAMIKKIPQLQEETRVLSLHINIGQIIHQATMDRYFRLQWQAERSMLEGQSKLDYIEECIARQAPLVKVLRLLCLQSLTGNGIKQTKYDQIRRDLIQVYGFEIMFTLNNLEKLGLLRNTSAQEKNTPWLTIRKAFKLIVSDFYEEGRPKDIAYVTAGYAPLSVRLIELAISPGGWVDHVEKLRIVPGPTICNVKFPGAAGQVPPPPAPKPSQDSSASASASASTRRNDAGLQQDDESKRSRKKILMVFIAGGITQMEIAAIRLVARATFDDVIIASSKIVNGTTLLNSFFHIIED